MVWIVPQKIELIEEVSPLSRSWMNPRMVLQRLAGTHRSSGQEVLRKVYPTLFRSTQATRNSDQQPVT